MYKENKTTGRVACYSYYILPQVERNKAYSYYILGAERRPQLRLKQFANKNSSDFNPK